jgi:acyl-CoA-binding protein
MFDIKEQFKWKTWTELKGISKDTAMEKYLDLVNKLLGV